MHYTFTSWERRRRHLASEADRVLPLIAAAGMTGITRRELGHAVDLDRDVLDGLLAGMAGAGLLTVAWEDGIPVYRCRY